MGPLTARNHERSGILCRYPRYVVASPRIKSFCHACSFRSATSPRIFVLPACTQHHLELESDLHMQAHASIYRRYGTPHHSFMGMPRYLAVPYIPLISSAEQHPLNEHTYTLRVNVNSPQSSPGIITVSPLWYQRDRFNVDRGPEIRTYHYTAKSLCTAGLAYIYPSFNTNRPSYIYLLIYLNLPPYK